MENLSHEEEKRLNIKRELDLYQCLVRVDNEDYQIGEEQTELTYKQRMLYLYTERKNFEQMAIELQEDVRRPSVVLEETYADIVDAYIPKEQQAAALALLDRYSLFSFPGGQGIQARSETFQKESSFLMHFFEDFKKQKSAVESSNVATVLLDSANGDETATELLQKLEGILCGKDVGCHTGYHAIWDVYALASGMIMNGDEKLRQKLLEQVKNNKVKEEFRQVLLQAIAEGSIETFLNLFQMLVENQMAKFRSVRRSVADWTGMYDKKTYEQITDDTLADIWKALTDEGYRKQLLQSCDTREFYLGIWAEGCFSVEKAMELGLACMKAGTFSNKLAVIYYAMKIENRHFSTRLMELAMQQAQGIEEDNQVLAALLSTYLRIVEKDCSPGREIDEILHERKRSGVEEGMVPERQPLPYVKYFISEEQARIHFSLLETLYGKLPKKKLRYDLQQLPIGKVMISQGEIAVRMLLIAYILQDEAMVDKVCPLINCIDSDYREACFDMCCAKPKTAIQRMTLIQALTMDKCEDIKRSGETILMKDFDREKKVFRTLEFTEEEFAEIAKVVTSPFLREWMYL